MLAVNHFPVIAVTTVTAVTAVTAVTTATAVTAVTAVTTNIAVKVSLPICYCKRVKL